MRRLSGAGVAGLVAQQVALVVALRLAARGTTGAVVTFTVATAVFLLPWAVLAVPATLLVGFAFSAVCMALTTFMRSWQDFDLVTLGVMPLFLFSATFFPITQYPGVLRWVVEVTPLYRGVVLCRELTTGAVSWGSAVSVVYLVAMGLLGLMVVSRRLGALLLR